LESSAVKLFSSISSILNGLISYASSLVMQVFILPVFDLVITAISIREIAELLGSEAFFGRFKVI